MQILTGTDGKMIIKVSVEEALRWGLHMVESASLIKSDPEKTAYSISNIKADVLVKGERFRNTDIQIMISHPAIIDEPKTENPA